MVVDSKHKLIVAHEVTTAVTDKDQLAPMATAAKQVLGVEKLDAVADECVWRMSNQGPLYRKQGR